MQMRNPPVSLTPLLSPTAEVKDVSKKSLHRHLMKWMERKVNRNIVRNPFENQEREARRRTMAPDPKLVPDKPSEPDSLSEFLRQHHKVQPSGLSILRLPRLPFGCHRTYNDEASFTQQHIVTSEASPRQAEELEALVKLYRLADKKKAKRGKMSPTGKKSPRREEVESFEGEGGTLYFPRQKRMLRAYENDKLRYKLALDLTFQPISPRHFPQSTHNRGQSLVSPTRLYPGKPVERQSRLSDSLTNKYSKLFDGEENQD